MAGAAASPPGAANGGTLPDGARLFASCFPPQDRQSQPCRRVPRVGVCKEIRGGVEGERERGGRGRGEAGGERVRERGKIERVRERGRRRMRGREARTDAGD
jgi:hypothetical protein